MKGSSNVSRQMKVCEVEIIITGILDKTAAPEVNVVTFG